MVKTIEGKEFQVCNVTGSNGLKNTIKVSHKDGYEYYIRPITVTGQDATIMFDNFSVTPFVISTTKTTITALKKGNTEEILSEIYKNNIINMDYGSMSVEKMLHDLHSSHFLPTRTYKHAIGDYERFIKKQ